VFRCIGGRVGAKQGVGRARQSAGVAARSVNERANVLVEAVPRKPQSELDKVILRRHESMVALARCTPSRPTRIGMTGPGTAFG
jgi:hypothetical protein